MTDFKYFPLSFSISCCDQSVSIWFDREYWSISFTEDSLWWSSLKTEATGLYIKLLPYIVYLWKFSGMRTMVSSGGTWMLLMIWYVSRYTKAIRYMYLDTIFNNTIVTRKVLICLSNNRSARVWFEENKMFMTNKTIQLHVVLEL